MKTNKQTHKKDEKISAFSQREITRAENELFGKKEILQLFKQLIFPSLEFNRTLLVEDFISKIAI